MRFRAVQTPDGPRVQATPDGFAAMMRLAYGERPGPEERAEFARELREVAADLEAMEAIPAERPRPARGPDEFDAIEETDGPGTNTGHGKVWPRPDGVSAKCRGPRDCVQCAADEGVWGAADFAAGMALRPWNSGGGA